MNRQHSCRFAKKCILCDMCKEIKNATQVAILEHQKLSYLSTQTIKNICFLRDFVNEHKMSRYTPMYISKKN
jgi:hypothetical protein